MMNDIRSVGNKICGLLCGLCAVLLVSCKGEEYDPTPIPVSLQLQVTARAEGDLNTKAGGVEVGINSEYMHNLCVLIVQDQVVVKKFLPDFTGNAAAQAGNLRSWFSDAFILETGNYTVYAFANINSKYSTAWSSITGIGERETLPSLHEIVLDNPMEVLDFKECFIPMSAQENVTVTPSTRALSIGLDRLLSKVRLAVSGKKGTQVTALSFGGYADKIPLFPDGVLQGETYENTKKVLIPGNGILTEGSLVLPDFYVNSSSQGHPFTVNIKTLETNGVVHDATAVTKRDVLPRNSIYPLTVQLNEYDLDLQAQCWVSPIGHLPVEVEVSFQPDTYEIEVPEGCQFAFTVAGITGSSRVEALSCTWNILGPIAGIEFDGETSGVQTVKGHVTAAAGKTFELGILVTWRDGSASYSRNYTVILKTKDLSSYPLYSQKRVFEDASGRLCHEMLNVFIK